MDALHCAMAPGLAAAVPATGLSPSHKDEDHRLAGAAVFKADEKVDTGDSRAVRAGEQPGGDTKGFTIVIGPGSAALSDLASRIDAAVRDAEQHARSAVDAAFCAGRLLTEAKDLLPYGQWEQWLKEHCIVAPRTAQAYMRLFKRMSELPAPEAQRVALLPLREAMAAITTPADTPPSSPRYPPSNDDYFRVRPIFATASRSLFNMSRDIGAKTLKRDRIKSLREKLAATVAELDRMLAEAQS
jgi:hypothetical protein